MTIQRHVLPLGRDSHMRPFRPTMTLPAHGLAW
jgi:hypothetical protein